MTADTQAQGDLIALARKCGAHASKHGNSRITFSRSELEAFAAALQGRAQEGEPSEWIRVEERFPEREVSVVGFWTPRDGKVHAGCYSTVCLNQYGVWVNPENDDDEYTQPTHWMPLPAAPVQGDAARAGGEGCNA